MVGVELRRAGLAADHVEAVGVAVGTRLESANTALAVPSSAARLAAP